MRPKIWADARTRTIVLIAAAAAMVLLTIAAMLLIPLTGNGASSALEPSARPTSPEASSSAPPRATPFTSPSPGPSSTPAPPPTDAAQASAPPPPPGDSEQSSAPAQPPVAEPAAEPPAAPMWPPSITAFGWVGSDYVRCPDMTSNQVVVKDFSWTANDASTVDLHVAMTDHDAQATAGYVMVASGLGPSGVTGVAISCGSTGLAPYYTIKIVATNAAGTSAAHMWGGTGL